MDLSFPLCTCGNLSHEVNTVGSSDVSASAVQRIAANVPCDSVQSHCTHALNLRERNGHGSHALEHLPSHGPG